MHPKSRDRTGNAKLLAKVAKAQGLPAPGPDGDGIRRSKYGARLAALRAKAARKKD